ncbi:NeuD/PglB/VioB family sugar acetyltransferase [Butyricimonas virosa]|uniref:NeuD/PglB/VioB family sugar acetyltransferase n=1 Tax=Butyricimonas virosa TaxID=544645 RepID=UPI0039F487D3
MDLVIIGAGGLAREVYDLACICFKDDSSFRIKGFIADSPMQLYSEKYPPYLGRIEEYSILPEDVFFCAIGNVYARKKCAEIILNKGGEFINLIAPGVFISPNAKIGKGVAIKWDSVLNSGVEIGDFSYIQTNVLFGHDVKVGSYCQISAMSFFAGGTKISNLVDINPGVRVIQNIKIEEGAKVGIGSVVISNVKSKTTVFGYPAKKLDF